MSSPCASHLDVERRLLRAARDVGPDVDAEPPGDEVAHAGATRADGIGVAKALRSPGLARAQKADQRPARRHGPAKLCLQGADVLILVASLRHAAQVDEGQLVEG